MRKTLCVVFTVILVAVFCTTSHAEARKITYSPLEMAISKVNNDQNVFYKLVHGPASEMMLLDAIKSYELELKDIDAWERAYDIGQVKLLNAGIITNEVCNERIAANHAAFNKEREEYNSQFLELLDTLKISKKTRNLLGM